MLFILNPKICLQVIKEGLALFNRFTGNTHFLPSSLKNLITALIDAPCSREELLSIFPINYQENTAEARNTDEQFEQFITEALNSGIMIET